MRFVIGDIHGEISKLKALIGFIETIDPERTLIFIGDYINKGENSKSTLDYLSNLKSSIFLMGNHEYYYLEFLKNKSYQHEILKYGEGSTFLDFNMTIPTILKKLYLPYKNFFDHLLPYYETEKYFISHAGINPIYLTEDLRTIPHECFLNNRYNFIRLSEKINDKTFIFGHTGFAYPYVDSVKIGIDTAAVYDQSNPLTAYCIEDEFFINSFNERKRLVDYSTNSCPIIIRKNPYRDSKNV